MMRSSRSRHAFVQTAPPPLARIATSAQGQSSTQAPDSDSHATDASPFRLLSLKDGIYRLTIDANTDYSSRVSSLEEEYAHALDGWKGGDDEKYDPDPHRDSWGVCLAKVRRAIDEILREID